MYSRNGLITTARSYLDYVERWEGYDSFEVDTKDSQGFLTTLKEVGYPITHTIITL